MGITISHNKDPYLDCFLLVIVFLRIVPGFASPNYMGITISHDKDPYLDCFLLVIVFYGLYRDLHHPIIWGSQ